MEDKSILLQTVKVEGGPKAIQILQVEINHEVNEFARAKVVMAVKEEDGTKFLKEAEMKKIKITAKTADKKDAKLFQGQIVNLTLENTPNFSLIIMELLDTACMLDIKRGSCTFQQLSMKREDMIKKVFGETGSAKFEKAKDKAVGQMVIRLNETEWEFARRMAGEIGAAIFTNIFSEKAAITIGCPAPQHTVTVETNQSIYNLRDKPTQFYKNNKDAKAEGLDLINEDFYSLKIGNCTEYLYIGDKVKLNDKEYFVKKVSSQFINGTLLSSYELVAKDKSFFSPIIPQQNLAGRVFRAQVKEVKNDKVKVHFVDIDDKFDGSTDNFIPFATPYSSQDGSGWYVMPEKEDYVRIMFSSPNTKDAFAISSINTAALKEPKNKSLKFPGPAGSEILMTDKGIEIIAKHQATFIQLDKEKGINIVSAKDIVISADGNINFDAKGKLQMISAKEITAQSGQSHVKLLSNQIAVGGGNSILGE